VVHRRRTLAPSKGTHRRGFLCVPAPSIRVDSATPPRGGASLHQPQTPYAIALGAGSACLEPITFKPPGEPPESNRRTRCPGFLTAYSHALPDDRPARERGEPKKPGDAPVSILTVVERGGDLRMGVLQAQNAGAIRYELGDCLERGTIITMDAAKNFGKTFRKMGRAVQFSL
jgi:hypothetical protein